MLLRIVSAFVLIPAVLAWLFLAPIWLFGTVLSLLTLLAVWELSRISERWQGQIYLPTYLLVALLPWALLSVGPIHYLAFAILTVLSWTVIRARDVQNALPSAGANLLALCYVAMPIALCLQMRFPGKGGFSNFVRPFLNPTETVTVRAGEWNDPTVAPWCLLLVLVTVWVADAGAYFTGKAIGRHKIVPVISPNKTLEGYVGGLVFGVATAVAFGIYFLPGRSFATLVITGIVLVVAAGMGDLFESLLKRGAGIKDSSNLIPGHGGVLDRIDSLLFAIPACYIVSVLL